MLSWQLAGFIAVALVATSWVAGWARPIREHKLRRGVPFVRETGIVLALYALWQLAGGLSLGHTGEAVGRGEWLWRLERAWWLPNEATMQAQILHHPLVVQFCNIYYATMHFGVLIAMLLWLFVRHRNAYPRIRTLIVLTTGTCLLLGLVPVAPPRLVHVGMLDTAQAYGQSVYAVTAHIGADQYSAMPSVHVAWAALVAVAVISVSRSRLRWLILLHTAATLYVVAVTANHFWLDGVAAVLLLGLSAGIQAVVGRLKGRRRLSASDLRGLENVADRDEESVDATA
jgi:hypothetical protein